MKQAIAAPQSPQKATDSCPITFSASYPKYCTQKFRGSKFSGNSSFKPPFGTVINID